MEGDKNEERLIPILMIMRRGVDFRCQLNLEDNLLESPTSGITALENILLAMMQKQPEFAEILLSASVRYMDPAQFNKALTKKKN